MAFPTHDYKIHSCKMNTHQHHLEYLIEPCFPSKSMKHLSHLYILKF